jgi:hypothetical protein
VSVKNLSPQSHVSAINVALKQHSPVSEPQVDLNWDCSCLSWDCEMNFRATIS